MEIKFDKKTLRNLVLIILGIIIVYWLLHDSERVSVVTDGIFSMFAPFVVGAVLAFILNVPMRAFEKLLKKISHNTLRRGLALLLTVLCMLIVLAGVFMLLIPQLIDTGEMLVPKISEFFNNMEIRINTFLANNPDVMKWVSENLNLQQFDWGSLAQKALGFLEQAIATLFPQTVTVIGNMASGFFSAFISVAFAIYALFQKETLARQGRKVAYAILPVRVADYIVRVLRLSNSTFSNFLSGQCVEVIILGSMFAITMAIFGMPYIPLISVLVAVTAFIPVVGAWVGCIVGAFLIMVHNPLLALWFIVMFVVLQQIENNVIYPRVVGTSIGLSGMWVLIAVALGGAMGGIVGMFLMIPLISVVYTLIREWINKRLISRQIEADKLMDHPPELRSHFKEQREKTKRKFELKKLLKREKNSRK